MSQQYPHQQQPDLPYPGGATSPPATPPPKAKHTRLIIGLVLGGALLFGAGVAVGAGSTSADTTQQAANSKPAAVETTPAPVPVVPEETTAEVPAEPTFGTPKKTDFKLTVKVLSKQCFGSAGCNLTYRILVSYTGPALDPATTYDVLYTVTGGEDGPVTNTLKVTGDEVTFDEEEFVSTKKKATTLTVAVSDVLG